MSRGQGASAAGPLSETLTVLGGRGAVVAHARMPVGGGQVRREGVAV